MQCGRRRRLLKPPVSQADRPRSGAPEAAIRLQVCLRIGRLTLGLTVADRWECSQATGLPAWRYQDLHITANRATQYHKHSNRRICNAVLVQAGPCV